MIRAWVLVYKNFTKMGYTALQNLRMKTFLQNDKFFRRDFITIYKFTKAMGGDFKANELIGSYIEYYKSQIKILENKYVPEAQILMNSRRYLTWLNSKLKTRVVEGDERYILLSPINHFGFFLREFKDNNIVEAPVGADFEPNYAACARAIKKAFFIPGKSGIGEVSDEYLADVISGRVDVADSVKTETKIPTYPSKKRN